MLLPGVQEVAGRLKKLLEKGRSGPEEVLLNFPQI